MFSSNAFLETIDSINLNRKEFDLVMKVKTPFVLDLFPNQEIVKLANTDLEIATRGKWNDDVNPPKWKEYGTEGGKNFVFPCWEALNLGAGLDEEPAKGQTMIFSSTDYWFRFKAYVAEDNTWKATCYVA